MNPIILKKTYSSAPINKREILRYASCTVDNAEMSALVDECLSTAQGEIAYRVCYSLFDLSVYGHCECDFGAFRFNSRKLALNLDGCEKAVIFAATLGSGMDRLIEKNSRLSPTRALIMQAIGAERIEALCDAFCKDIEKEYGTARPRFSPGYGDLALECQKDIFRVLDCERQIGLTLGESLIMSPSKSVTAIVGIGGKNAVKKDKCQSCNMKNCPYGGSV